jgi:hypothetical protein
VQGYTAASTSDNANRISIIEELVSTLRTRADWHPIDAIVLPGGFFWLSRVLGYTTFERRRDLISQERVIGAVRSALKQLQELSPGIRLVTGVMAQPRDKNERTEQACLAFDQMGLIGAARKMFPTHNESRGRRFMTPFADDYRSSKRFVDLPNGSLAALHSCYDLFGTADIGSVGGARRAAIRVLRQPEGRLAEGHEDFKARRDGSLGAWADLVASKAPDVLLATIHAFEKPGLDGYWQRHGIARASAAHGGALTIGAAHFLESLPRGSSTLAAYGVPKRELSAGGLPPRPQPGCPPFGRRGHPGHERPSPGVRATPAPLEGQEREGGMTLQHQLPLSHALSWAGPELLGLAKDYPGLALQLLTVPKQRLHFVAFVLAMTAPPVSADLARQAVTLLAREVLGRLGLSELRGVRRVLGRIHGPVLDRGRYLEIASLLSEPTTAQVLYHTSEVTPELLANLSTLPLTLRSHVIADAIGHISNAAAHLVEWTEIVADRLFGTFRRRLAIAARSST